MSSPSNNHKNFSFYIIGTMYSGRGSFLDVICDAAYMWGHEARYEDELPENIDKIIERVGVNWAKIIISEDETLYFHSSPYSDYRKDFSIRRIYDFLYEYSTGLVVMLDSSTPETFNDTRNLIQDIYEFCSVPFVVAANKQDLPDAWPVQDIRIALSIEAEIAIIPCSIYDKKSLANVLIALCEEIIEVIEAQDEEA